MDMTWFVDLQQALVYLFAPVMVVLMGIIFVGSILAAIFNLFVDVAAWLFRS